MSGANIVPIIAASTAVITAAAAKKKRRQEEERMVTYNKEDLSGWEFKIVRSATGAFRKPEKVRQVCEEEAKAGWEMLEKFDNNRIRFKRRADRRSADQYIDTGIDPYRTDISSAGAAIAVIVAVIAVLIGALALIGFRIGFDRGALGGVTVAGLIVLVGIVIVIIGVIAAIRAGRSR
ncbi:MAG: hypothetical protein JSV44_04780 [Candidatus Zixiibacteriota bacterium]|nr:MAG: hypothetical protein JSV44_04780 [candidate division Zixibacteria bacterium]